MRRRTRGLVVAVAAAGVASSPAVAGAQESAPPCAELEAYRALDFWVGEWTVWVGETQVGSNHIRPVLDGCALEEHWTAVGGGQGQSLFYYVPGEEEWRQVWVTATATAPGGVKEKRLVAHLPDGGVRFQGEVVLTDGRRYLDRTTLSPLAGGRVRQLIEISTDGGVSWRPTFDAVYVPVPPS